MRKGWGGFTKERSAAAPVTRAPISEKRKVNPNATKTPMSLLPKGVSRETQAKTALLKPTTSSVKKKKPMKHGDDTANKAVDSRSDLMSAVACGGVVGDPGLATFGAKCAVSDSEDCVDAEYRPRICPAQRPINEEKEEDLAGKLVCNLSDDEDEDFAIRAHAIQTFTDRMTVEREQIRNRLLDVHAEVSENLLDAITGLLAEEGGIGIDKLNVDINIDMDSSEITSATHAET
ncbi:hypothetical protein PHYBOEH_003656 [Phytophthora boehmeriae]|uniref:Uncharacterized protein n=1 Tax=Phytophthora boehmeriae TaxID=109152 RepID=A0A8T1WQ01_9STRA|nr:hypothetical protein PHYBOEH_003656 [Phytophthora boehmeriae]